MPQAHFTCAGKEIEVIFNVDFEYRNGRAERGHLWYILSMINEKRIFADLGHHVVTAEQYAKSHGVDLKAMLESPDPKERETAQKIKDLVKQMMDEKQS